MTKGDNEGINRFVSFYGNTNIEEDLSMNKTEFINAVAEKSGLSKVDAKKAVEAFVETVSSELKEGGKVALLGFGSFSVAEKSARKGVNPKTKQPIEIPARKSVKFKAGAELTEIIK